MPDIHWRHHAGYSLLKRFDEALEDAERCIKLNPSWVMVRPITLALTTQLVKTAVWCTHPFSVRPLCTTTFVQGYSRKGRAVRGLGKLDESIRSFEKGLQIEPGNEELKG